MTVYNVAKVIKLTKVIKLNRYIKGRSNYSMTLYYIVEESTNFTK